MKRLHGKHDPAALSSRLIRRPIQRMVWLFLLPTFAEIRRVVEDEWNEDMDRIEAENKEAHPHVASDDVADDDADSDIRSHEDPSHDADPAKGGTER